MAHTIDITRWDLMANNTASRKGFNGYSVRQLLDEADTLDVQVKMNGSVLSDGRLVVHLLNHKKGESLNLAGFAHFESPCNDVIGMVPLAQLVRACEAAGWDTSDHTVICGWTYSHDGDDEIVPDDAIREVGSHHHYYQFHDITDRVSSKISTC